MRPIKDPRALRRGSWGLLTPNGLLLYVEENLNLRLQQLLIEAQAVNGSRITPGLGSKLESSLFGKD